MSELWFPAPPAPRIPRLRAPIVFRSGRETVRALGYSLIGLAIVAAFWAAIILPIAWLYRRLHFH